MPGFRRDAGGGVLAWLVLFASAWWFKRCVAIFAGKPKTKGKASLGSAAGLQRSRLTAGKGKTAKHTAWIAHLVPSLDYPEANSPGRHKLHRQPGRHVGGLRGCLGAFGRRVKSCIVCLEWFSWLFVSFRLMLGCLSMETMKTIGRPRLGCAIRIQLAF